MIKYIFCSVFFLITAYFSYAEEDRIGLENRLNYLESEIAKVSRNLTEISSNNETKNQKSYSDLYAKIVDIEERLRELNGKLEHVEYTSKQLIGKLSNLTEDINYRFTKLERSKDSREQVGDLRDGIKMFEDGKYRDARESLHSYIKIAQGNDKGEAYYWMGKCYMEENIYKEAGTYFLKSYKYYPSNSKATDSLLNLAISLKKLDKRNRACSILSRLDLEYPNRSKDQKELSKQEQDFLKCS
jgi:TolA-binding protein